MTTHPPLASPRRLRAAGFVIALSLAGLAPAAYAQGSNVTLYGTFNADLDLAKGSASTSGVQLQRSTRVSSNSSNIGFRGTEDLGGGLRAIWQYEAGIALDLGTLSGRNTHLGLAGNFGTVFLGNWDTPYKWVTLGHEPFYATGIASYNGLLSNGTVTAPNGGAAGSLNAASFDRRQNNVLQYWTPNLEGFAARVAFGAPEERTAFANPSLLSASILYENGPLHLSFAHERHRDYQGAGRTDTGSKLGAAYRFGATRVALIHERLEYEAAAGGELKRNAWYVSVVHAMGPGSIRFAYTRAADATGSAPVGTRIGKIVAGGDTGASQLTIGYDYALSKRSSLYGYYTRIGNDSGATYDFGVNPLTAGGIGVSPGSDLTGLAVGLRHTF